MRITEHQAQLWAGSRTINDVFCLKEARIMVAEMRQLLKDLDAIFHCFLHADAEHPNPPFAHMADSSTVKPLFVAYSKGKSKIVDCWRPGKSAGSYACAPVRDITVHRALNWTPSVDAVRTDSVLWGYVAVRQSPSTLQVLAVSDGLPCSS